MQRDREQEDRKKEEDNKGYYLLQVQYSSQTRLRPDMFIAFVERVLLNELVATPGCHCALSPLSCHAYHRLVLL